MDRNELRRLARIGASARLAELEHERAALLRVFPGLRAASTRSGQSANGASAHATGKRKRHNMSAAARRAVSVRMKRYWAARRKEKAAKAAKA